MNKLKLYAIGSGCVVGLGLVYLRASGSDAGKTPDELAVQRATLNRVVAEETEGRLTDKNNRFDAARFVTRTVRADLNISNPKERRNEANGRVDLVFSDALAAAGTGRGQDRRTDALVACAIWALQSGQPNDSMFQNNTLELYSETANDPAKYDIVRDRCLGSVAARVADGQITTIMYPWKVA